MGEKGDAYRTGAKRIVRPAVAKISAMIGSEDVAADVRVLSVWWRR